jgi:hypothetical protein
LIEASASQDISDPSRLENDMQPLRRRLQELKAEVAPMDLQLADIDKKYRLEHKTGTVLGCSPIA